VNRVLGWEACGNGFEPVMVRGAGWPLAPTPRNMSNSTLNMAKTIVLIGMRGSGKTVVGKELARRLGGAFLDTDDLVVQAAGQTIAEIFTAGGEPEFRRLEREAVARAVAEKPSVLSVGGGAVVDPQNAALLRSAGPIIWLIASPEVLVSRIQLDPNTATARPPLTNADVLTEMHRLLRERAPIYEGLAQAVIDTSELTVEEVARAILNQTRESS
jgi:shikimate kinase